MSLAEFITQLPQEDRAKFPRARFDRYFDGKMDTNELGLFVQDMLELPTNIFPELPFSVSTLAAHYVRMGVCTINGRLLQ